MLAVWQSPAVSDVLPVAREVRLPRAAVKELSGEPFQNSEARTPDCWFPLFGCCLRASYEAR
jgi:hypothetical protein